MDPIPTVGNAQEILRELLALGLISSSKFAEINQSLQVAAGSTPGSAICSSMARLPNARAFTNSSTQ